jgi:hypothetical protein
MTGMEKDECDLDAKQSRSNVGRNAHPAGNFGERSSGTKRAMTESPKQSWPRYQMSEAATESSSGRGLLTTSSASISARNTATINNQLQYHEHKTASGKKPLSRLLSRVLSFAEETMTRSKLRLGEVKMWRSAI